ncbi:heparinase II/III family protein [Candidatus Latescibacterota bacterium]
MLTKLKRLTCQSDAIKHYCINFMTIFAAGIFFFSHATFVSCAVLVTDDERTQITVNLAEEPLRTYFRTLSRGGGGRAAPILYLITGDEKYARTAKESIKGNLESLRKFLPYKINIWMLHGPGWVESSLLAYDMTRDSGLYTNKEISDMKETLYWSVKHFLNEGTDHIGKGFLYQTDFIPEDHEDWVIANMNVHRLQAVGLYALVFPNEPRSKEITKYTVDYFERILSLGSRPGGAWAENPRYAAGVLSRLYMLAAGLKNAGVHDFFRDERFKVMLGFFAESIPVPGMEGPDKPTKVAAADTDWYENGTALLSWSAPRYYRAEPDMAGEWIWCWKQSESPLSPESLLFINPEIKPVKPDYSSYTPGMGYVIFRDRFAEPDETFFFATFGPELGTSNHTMHHHPNHGDFSLIWRGNPILLTRGCSSYVWSRRMRDQTDFSHSVVTYDGSGESIAIPEKKYSGPAVEVNTTIDEKYLRDYYPDGITHFVSTSNIDYAAGQVRNWDIGLPAPLNRRHCIFLKPDTFVIWDQVRSSYPIQWNLHIPADNVESSDKSIVVTTRDGVKLSMDFLQDEPLDFTSDWPLENIRTEWPMVLSCPYGKGMFVFNALDITRQILDNNHTGARKILENLISYPKRPKRIGIIETDGQSEEVLKQLGFTCELLDYDDLEGDLSRFDTIVVGHFAVLVRDRDMLDYSEKLWKYVEDGGVCYWGYQYAWGWRPGDTSGPGYFPHTLMVGEGTSVLWGEGIDLTLPVIMDGDPIWSSPNRITKKDWDGWQVGPPDTYKMLHYNTKPNTDRARNIPVSYSDHWRVHASALKTYNINIPRTRKRFGPYRWLKVHHNPSDDFFTVIRPWGKNDSGPSAEIIRRSENEAVITQGNDCWRILLGNHPGFTGNLAILRYTQAVPGLSAGTKITAADVDKLLETEPREIVVVDAVEAVIGSFHFDCEYPATFSFDFEKSSGNLSLLEGGNITLPWQIEKAVLSQRTIKTNKAGTTTSLNVPPGEFAVRLENTSLTMDIINHVGSIEVVDKHNNPVPWVHILRDLRGKNRTAFQGATDKQGRLTIKWEGKENQTITLSKGKLSSRAKIKPGLQRIVF